MKPPSDHRSGRGHGRPHGPGRADRPHGGERGHGEGRTEFAPRRGGERDRPDRGHGGAPHARPPRPEQASRPHRDFTAEHRPPPRGPAAPRGTVWIYGVHPVAAALANPARRLRRLVLTEEAEAAIATHLPRPWPLQPERSERERLDQMLGRDAVHQGAALLADPLTPPVLAQTLERPGAVLVLDQVTDPRNVGAILRSAAAFGAAAVIVQERHAPEETGALAKAASGALETVPLLRAVNLARTLVALKAAGLWTVGLDADAPPLSGPDLAARRVALVLGAEGEGLRRLTRETCDEVAGLPMPGAGRMASLNVAAAAAVALYELARR
ncbi:MAG TPA: RNA methyltransferase [Acetobacteraceae bacterium]|nr:RNA methyltransferase [Acetobacteraceae bacterium]